MDGWTSFDEVRPEKAGLYKWAHVHPLGFRQIFIAKMRLRGAGHDQVLSPDFDHWNGYSVSVPKGFYWRSADDQERAEHDCKYNVVQIENINLRPCPFCGTPPNILASQCGRAGGGNGQVVLADPQNYNTWRVTQCCKLIGFNGFKSPADLAAMWNGKTHDPRRRSHI